MGAQLATVVLIAVVLGMDAFSLAMGMGLNGVSKRYEIKFAFAVGVMHIVMPLIGLSLGLAVGKILGVWAGWLGALILTYIGVNFLRHGWRDIKGETLSWAEARKRREKREQLLKDNFKTILVLAFSVSVDALTVGFSLGTLNMPLLATVIIMGVVAGTMTFMGFVGGRFFSKLVGSYAQMAGGAVLLALAVKLVV
ncbi:Putative Mn2+ efflux pump MntP [Thermosyntropha lipolytica DSM 11003]|uniref:Putative manganese efflux pump MntP n=1 Tax=Thermosyntropha lipolytica DSM 11003 TaxID=1123382 RepID=A0A1M5NV22_9FIRM|nr:manganese efflux pump MntP family protein [Thermosyntropha lipolytica]SHG93362.1 Putative Mn2+ efflux pump MntP [Thermosyntropha lipolytica DSM 11003]